MITDEQIEEAISDILKSQKSGLMGSSFLVKPVLEWLQREGVEVIFSEHGATWKRNNNNNAKA